MIRTAVVGTGAAAKLHVAAVRAAAPELEVVAIAGRDHAAAERLAADAGPGVAVMTPEDAVRSRAIDAVVLAVPASVLPWLAVTAFTSGKHVLCEKPLAPTAEGARAIEQAWRSAGTIGMVNFGYRLIPAIADFRRCLDEGVCGELSWIEAQWVLSSRLDPSLPFSWKADASAGGGALRNFGSHVFDYLLRGRDARVMAAWLTTRTVRRRDAGGIDRTATADEVMTAMFDVAGWCPVFVHVSLVTRPQIGHRLIARGSAGTLTAWNTSTASPAGPFACTFNDGAGDVTLAPADGPPVALDALFGAVVARFAGAVAGRAGAEPDIAAGVRTAELADAVASASTGLPSSFNPMSTGSSSPAVD